MLENIEFRSTNIKNLIEIEDIHPKLADAIIELIVSRHLPYYGEFSQFINFFRAKIDTCGVNVTSKGMCFYWGESFINEHTPKEIIFTVIHEVFHLLFEHIKRGVGYNKKIANLAMDQIINSVIHGDLMIGEDLAFMMDIPKDKKGRNNLIFLSKEYEGEPIFEEVYAWLMKQYLKWQEENKDWIEKLRNVVVRVGVDGKGHIDDDFWKDNDDGYGPNGKSGDKGQNPVDMFPIERFFESAELDLNLGFDIHFDDDVCEDVRKQWSHYVTEKLKERGLETNSVEKILNKLRKTEKDYLKEIKRAMSNDIFGNKKNKSITKPNRRGIEGIKGNRKYKNKINCILDTSGSMGNSFEQVLSYIFGHDIEISLVECDVEVKKVITIKSKSELQKLKICGLGGTTLSSGIQFIANDKKLSAFPLVILSDGYTDELDFTGIKKNVLIISTGTSCPIAPGTNSHGIKIKQYIIEKRNS